MLFSPSIVRPSLLIFYEWPRRSFEEVIHGFTEARAAKFQRLIHQRFEVGFIAARPAVGADPTAAREYTGGGLLTSFCGTHYSSAHSDQEKLNSIAITLRLNYTTLE